jgi:hypothetical protein
VDAGVGVGVVSGGIGCGVEVGAGLDGRLGDRGTVRPQPPMNNTTPVKTKIGWRTRVSSSGHCRVRERIPRANHGTVGGYR